MDKMSRCPVCGSVASVTHLVGDGMDFGWMAGCTRFCINDGIHGVTDDTPVEKHLSVHGFSKKAVVEAWNRKVEEWH